MNKEQMRARLAEIAGLVGATLARVQGGESLTDAEASAHSQLIEEGARLRTSLAQAEEQERQAQELLRFVNQPVAQGDLAGNTVQVQGQRGATPGLLMDPRQALNIIDDRRARQVSRSFVDAFHTDMAHRGLSGNVDRLVQRWASEEYEQDFMAYVRTHGADRRALNESAMVDGGATVPIYMLARIIERRAAIKRVGALVTNIPTTTENLPVPKFNGGDDKSVSDLTVQYLGEGGTATEDTALEGDFGQITITQRRGGLVLKIQRALLEDSMFDLETWLMEKVADLYEANKENQIINGTGVGRPFGLITRTGAGEYPITTFNIGDAIDPSLLVAAVGQIGEQYAANASFLMKRATFFSQIASLRDSVGGFIYGTTNTTAGGATGRIESQVLGYPNVLSDWMPGVGAANKVAYFGDLREAYIWTERIGLTIEPLYDSAAQVKDQRSFYVRFRHGGDVAAQWAIRALINSD